MNKDSFDPFKQEAAPDSFDGDGLVTDGSLIAFLDMTSAAGLSPSMAVPIKIMRSMALELVERRGLKRPNGSQ